MPLRDHRPDNVAHVARLVFADSFRGHLQMHLWHGALQFGNRLTIQPRIKNVTTIGVTYMIMDRAGSGIGAVTRNSGDLAGIKRHLRVVGLYLAGAVGGNHDWRQG